MPSDARFTGLHRGDWRLWVSRSMLDAAVYLTDSEAMQASSYVVEPVYCQ